METLQNFGLPLILALQTLSPTLDGFMHLFTFLGRIHFYLLVLPLLYWTLDRRLGLRLILILLLTDLLGSLGKLLLHQPRPYWLGTVQALTTEPSYGIPSTHASDSLAVWGYLTYRWRRTWLAIVIGVLVVFIGLSRLYLGVHFPHDVLVGWLIGGGVFVVFIQCEPAVTAWTQRHGVLAQIGLGLAGSLLILLLSQLIQAVLVHTPDPDAWSTYAATARTLTHSFTLGGALLGAVAGYSLMQQRARFGSGGPWLKRVGRYGLGIVGVLVIYFGLDVGLRLLASDETTVGYALRYLRYAAVTFWATFGAPWVFLRVRLAESDSLMPEPFRDCPSLS